MDTVLKSLHHVDGVLFAADPYDFHKSLRFIQEFPPGEGDQILEEGRLTKAVSIDGQVVAFTITPANEGVAYTLRSHAPIDDTLRDRIASLISSYLGLQDELAPFYASAAGDHPRYRRIVELLHGLHHVRFLTLAEAGVWFVLSQRTPRFISLPTKARITRTFGRSIEIDGQTLWAFPELSTLAHLEPSDWFETVKHERKADYLCCVLRGLDEIGADYLTNAPYDDATAALLSIRGIGAFTAAAILLRGLGRMDVVPLEMPKFASVTQSVYGPRASNDELRARYGPMLGYWSYYLMFGSGELAEDDKRLSQPVAS